MKKLLNYKYRAVALLVIAGLIYLYYQIFCNLLCLPTVALIICSIVYFVCMSFIILALFFFGTLQDEELKQDDNDRQN